MRTSVSKFLRFAVCGLLISIPAYGFAQENIPVELSLNVPQIVQLDGTGSIDLSYTGTQGETIFVAARSLEVSGVVDTTLELLDGSGQRIAFNDDNAQNSATLDPYDAFIEEVTLSTTAPITVRLGSFSGAAFGRVEVLVTDTDTLPALTQPQLVMPTTVPTTAPIASEEQDNVVAEELSPVLLDATVMANSAYDYKLEIPGPMVITISARATDNMFDPKLAVYAPDGSLIAENDDHSGADSNLAIYDSQIANLQIPRAGVYRIRVTGYADTGGTFELSVVSSGSNTAQSSSEGSVITTEGNLTGIEAVHQFDGLAGDVYEITVFSRSTLDPQVALYAEGETRFIARNDDHGSSDRELMYTDARIGNIILQNSGTYDVVITGYNGGVGEYELRIERIAQNAPLGRGVEEVFTAEVEPNRTYSQVMTFSEGDFVTLSVRALSISLDPRVSILDENGIVVASNDDHGGGISELGFYDSRIMNFWVPSDGEYSIEIAGYQNSAGSFALTLETLSQ